MEEQLREHLKDGEQLLWSGCPEPFDTLDKTNKNSIIVGLIIKALVTLGLIIGFLAIVPSRSDTSSIVIIIFILLSGIFAIVNPFLVAGRMRKQVIYGLTDKGIMRSGNNNQAIPYERIKKAMLRTDADGHVTLLGGSRACKLRPSQWRGEADAAFLNDYDDSEAERVILYALPMDNKLREVLYKYLPLE